MSDTALFIGLFSMLGAGVIAIIAYLLYQHVKQTRYQAMLQAKFQSFTAALSELRQADIKLSHTLAKLAERLDRISHRQDDFEVQQEGPGAYNQAIKMLEMGVSPEDVMQACNLSRAELDLLFHLQKNRQP